MLSETIFFFIKDFYARYKADEEIIQFLNHTINKGNIFEKYWYMWTKAFIYARYHDMDNAFASMRQYYDHRQGVIPKKVIEKLEAVDNLSQ